MARAKKDDVQKAPEIDTFDEHALGEKVILRNAYGNVKTYQIHEIRKGGMAWWLNNVQERAGDDSFDYDGMMEDLLEQCMSHEDGTPVDRRVIDGWGDKCKALLYQKARLVAGIDQAEADRQGKK